MSVSCRHEEHTDFGEGKVAFRVTIRDVGLSARPWRWVVKHRPDGVDGKVMSRGKCKTSDEAVKCADEYIENVLVDRLRIAAAMASLKIGYKDRLTLEQTAERARGLNQVAGSLDDAQPLLTPATE